MRCVFVATALYIKYSMLFNSTSLVSAALTYDYSIGLRRKLREQDIDNILYCTYGTFDSKSFTIDSGLNLNQRLHNEYTFDSIK